MKPDSGLSGLSMVCGFLWTSVSWRVFELKGRAPVLLIRVYSPLDFNVHHCHSTSACFNVSKWSFSLLSFFTVCLKFSSALWRWTTLLYGKTLQTWQYTFRVDVLLRKGGSSQILFLKSTVAAKGFLEQMVSEPFLDRQTSCNTWNAKIRVVWVLIPYRHVIFGCSSKF